MRPSLIRVLLLSMVGVLIFERVEADPVVAFSNIPPPANYKVGGSPVTGGSLKALLFTTPSLSNAMLTSVKVGLTYCNSAAVCGRAPTPVDVYPSQADFQVSIYSVRDQGGVLTPDVELYSIPMQYGLTLTGRGTEFTFDIPNWQLAENTTYALVGRSTDTNPVKWANIELGSPPSDYPPQAQNGFTFSSTQAFTTSQAAPTIWIDAGLATNNAVEVKFLFVPSLSITNSPQTYRSSPIAAVVTCSSGGTVSNVLYGGSGTVPSATGTYAITADCAASSNYSAVTGASAGNFVITAATPTLSVTNSPQTYTGSAIPAVVSCLGGGTVSNVKYNNSSTVPSAVASYAITADCAASTNYSAVTGASAGNFVIAAAPTPPTPFVPSPTMQTTVSVGGSVNLSISGGNGNPVVTYMAVALPQAQAAARSAAPRTGALVCTIVGSVLTPTGGTGVCQVTAAQGAYGNYQAQTTTFNITVTAAPSPAPIPTLSEWAQIMMMFMMILTVGFYGWRTKQR